MCEREREREREREWKRESKERERERERERDVKPIGQQSLNRQPNIGLVAYRFTSGYN